MTARGAVPVRQCLAFRLAGFLGILLAVISALDGDWVSFAVGVAGTATMVVVYLRRCRLRA